jgi:hypothetical protein
MTSTTDATELGTQAKDVERHLRREQLAAATGIAFVVLAIVSTVMAGSPPKPDDATQKVVHYLVEKRGQLLADFSLNGLEMILLIWFVGVVRSVLGTSEGGNGRLSNVAFGPGLIIFPMGLAGILPQTAIVWRGADRTDPALVRLAYDTALLASGVLINFPAAIFLGAASVVIWRSRVLPRLLSYLGGGGALVCIIAGFSLARSGPMAPGGFIGYLLTFLIFTLWVLVTSILLVRRARPTNSNDPAMV